MEDLTSNPGTLKVNGANEAAMGLERSPEDGRNRSSTTARAISPDSHQETSRLVRQAHDLIRDGELQQAKACLQKASSIAPEAGNDAEIRDAWQALFAAESQQDSPVALVKQWINTREVRFADEAVKHLSQPSLDDNSIKRCIEALMDVILYPLPGVRRLKTELVLKEGLGEFNRKADELTALVLRRPMAQKYLVVLMREHPTFTFAQIFHRGDGSVDGLVASLLSDGLWEGIPSAQRVDAIRNTFVLGLAQMMQAGLEFPERAMKIITRLLAAKSDHLKGIIDSDTFDVILEHLDNRLPKTLRSHATLATAKLLEQSPEVAEKLVTEFVTSRVTRPTTDHLILAFSAVGSIFPLAPALASSLFLTDDFISNFEVLMQSKKSQALDVAALDLLNSACINKACREAIHKHCQPWLLGLCNITPTKYRSNLAALVLMKISESIGGNEQDKVQDVTDSVDQEELLLRFREAIESGDNETRRDAIQGVGFAALKPSVKEALASDGKFLSSLARCMDGPTGENPPLYAGLTVLQLLSEYRPVKSEEEKHMAKLKAYAAASKGDNYDPLDDDERVDARCQKLIDANIVETLFHGAQKGSLPSRTLIAAILKNLSRAKSHRGKLAQQGVPKLLLQMFNQTATNESLSSISLAKQNISSGGALDSTPIHISAAHALAQILITVQPHLIFEKTGNLSTQAAIRALVSLLPYDSKRSTTGLQDNAPRDLRPGFDALLALTNLATYPENLAFIASLTCPALMDDLMWNSNEYIQRASVELVCNFASDPDVIAPFYTPSPSPPTTTPSSPSGSDPHKGSARRLDFLLVMAHSTDDKTRIAAAGALAMLTTHPLFAAATVAADRGIATLLSLCGEDSDDDARHRGVVALWNLVSLESDQADGRDWAPEAARKIRAAEGEAELAVVVTRCGNKEAVQLALEVLKKVRAS